MFKNKLMAFVTLLVVTVMLVSGCQPETIVVTQIVEVPGEVVTVEIEVPGEVTTVEVPVTAEPTPDPLAERRGAIVDTIIVVEEPNADQAITRLEVGEMDLYAYTVGNAESAAAVEASSVLDSYMSLGSYNELTFNPVGPVFEGTGKLNPFAVPAVREAMHILMDRNYIVQEILGGMGVPRWTCFNSASGDAAVLADVIRGIELKYAYDRDKADALIAAEMETLGATREGGLWMYNGEPVEIIILIRTEDERRPLGDYVANQLEDIGFTVRREYRTSAEASPIWMRGNPGDGLFHIYTGGWITTAVPRDLNTNFAFFYTNMGLGVPLWQAYVNTPEFYDLSQRLNTNDFKSIEERTEMMAQALEMSMQDSVRMFLYDRSSITPKRQEVSVAADLYGGVSGSALWAQTIQRPGQIGGSLTIGQPSILTEPWNPVEGTNWIYDMMHIRATGEMGLVPDPYTGLSLPSRIERAEVTVQEGLPVFKTLDWVTLEFAPEIALPDDAWAGWSAEEQRFLTASEVYTEPMTVLRKSVVYYPADLYDTVKWHDGSPFSVADIVMYMIMQFDRAQTASAIYDESNVPTYESFMSAFRGVRIVSEDPLVIETYSDLYYPDAENSVDTWFPYYGYGEGAWHTLTLGIMAETNLKAAFSAAKADANEIEWLSYIAGPTVVVLEEQLTAQLENPVLPYEPTMSQYVSVDEALVRFQNLAEWFRRRGHFWVGTGPMYLERAFPVEGTLVLQRNRDYPDLATRWLGFAEAPIPDVMVDGPGRVTIGEEAAFDVVVEFAGAPYAIADINNVKFLVLGATGEVAYVGAAEAVEDGLWQIVLSADMTKNLEAGSNQLEVIVVSNRVAVPSSDAITFVTAP